jgi:hypothetical protein
MRRLLTTTLIVPLALALSGPTWGQPSDNSQTSSERAQRQAEQNRQSARQRRQQQQQREARQRSQEDSQQSSQSDRDQARAHYRAGLVAGYMLGYADGLDDYVIIVGTRSRGREATTSAEGENQRLRDQMRQRARSRAMERQQDRPASAGRIASSSQQRVSGEIRSMKRVTLQNDNQRHLLLLVRTEDNRRRIVDVGPESQLQNLDLQPGDTITAVGRFLRTRDGIPVLNAQRIESQGHSIAIRANGQSQQRTRR